MRFQVRSSHIHISLMTIFCYFDSLYPTLEMSSSILCLTVDCPDFKGFCLWNCHFVRVLEMKFGFVLKFSNLLIGMFCFINNVNVPSDN